MPVTLRHATLDDVELITRHRHLMFAANQFGTEDVLNAMDVNLGPWLRHHIAKGTYIGLFLEDDEAHTVLAGAGIYLMDWPPHYHDPNPVRAYLLNFYTAPEARGHGYANQLLAAAVEECRTLGIKTVTLHASPFGRPIYEKFGFQNSNEMMLTL